MPKSSKIDNVSENEEQSVKISLATLRSRNETNDLLNSDMLIIKPNDNWLFYSITIPPSAVIKIRGKKVPYAEAPVAQQYYYFNNRIMHYKFEYVKNAYIIIEHNKNGVLHFHICINIGTEYQHNIDIELSHLFHISKTHKALNLSVEPVRDFYRIISYFFKLPTVIVGQDTQESNAHILKKQYEISKYNIYHITPKTEETYFDYGEYFND